MMKYFGWSVLMLGLCTSLCEATLRDLPIFRVPDCLGVDFQSTNPQEDELEPLAEAGFSVARMELRWGDIEQEAGVYDFSVYVPLTDTLRERGIVPMYILSTRNPIYEDDAGVLNEEGRDAFTRFATEALMMLGDGPVIWELAWQAGTEPESGIDTYIRQVETTVTAMRAIDPHCTIVAPATTPNPLQFLEQCFQNGLLKWINAVTVHPYRETIPETVVDEYAALRELIDRYSSEKFVPIISGEWGYAVSDDDEGIDPATQANYVVRQFLSNFIGKVRLSIWHTWRDETGAPSFGTMTTDLTPRPAYRAIQVFTEQLDGLTYITTLPSERDGDYLVVFSNGEREVLVAWTTESPRAVFLPLDSDIRVATTQQGRRIPVYSGDAGLELPLTEEPLYLHADRIRLQ